MVIESGAGKACLRLIFLGKILKKITHLFLTHLRRQIIVAVELQLLGDITI